VRQSLFRAARGRHAAVVAAVLCWTAAGLTTGARVAGEQSPATTQGSSGVPAIGRLVQLGVTLQTAGRRTSAALSVPVPRLRRL
jgi:hypothetical protein